MDEVSRRRFLGTGTVAGVAALVPVAGAAQQSARDPAPTASAPQASGWRFFMPVELSFVEAAVERLIPPDGLGPSALEADVPRFIDLQLAGAWGSGERLYRGGPWQQGTKTQGYQLPFTPAELFRTALRGIRNGFEAEGRPPFERLPGAQQDAYLSRLQQGGFELDGVPAEVFFESLLAMTIEGYFGDPAYGGNRDMAAWKMIGFPGAYANYHSLVDRHGIAFVAAPRSLAEGRSGAGDAHGSHGHR